MTEKTFDLHGPINLDCRLGFGAVSVKTEAGLARARVSLRARRADSDAVDRTLVEMRGPTLVIHGPRPRGLLFDVPVFTRRFRDQDALDVDVTVPDRTAMKVTTFGADITISGCSGGAEVASGTATIRVDDVDGDLRLRYGSGPATVRHVTGSVEAKYGSGKLDLGDVGGHVDVACGSGSMHVGVAHGNVRLRTGSGGATVDVAEADVELTSGSGDLSVGLRPGRAARLDVVTGSGRLHSELAVEDAPPAGKDAATIRARTGSGDVHLRRASSQAMSA